MEKYDELIDTLSGYVEVSKAGTIRHYNKHGKLHRTGGPAVITPSGMKAWYQNGVYHRIGGPAITYPGGGENWYIEGTIHRTDGPAVTFYDGRCCWLIGGTELSEEEFRKRVASGGYLTK